MTGPTTRSGKLLTPVEAAAALRVSRSTVYRLIADDELLGVRVGRSLRVPENALQLYRASACGNLTVREVAVDLGVSKMTVYRLVAGADLPGERIGRCIRIPADAYDRYRRSIGIAA